MSITSFKISQELMKNKLKANYDEFWIQFNDKTDPELRRYLTVKEEFSAEKITAAYNLEAILNVLPKKHDFFSRGAGNYQLKLWYIGETAFIGYHNCEGSDSILTQEQQKDESLADMAAKLWLKLKENKII